MKRLLGFYADAPQQVDEPRILSNCVESGANLEGENPRLALRVSNLELLERPIGVSQPGVDPGEILLGDVAFGRPPSGSEFLKNLTSFLHVSDSSVAVVGLAPLLSLPG